MLCIRISCHKIQLLSIYDCSVRMTLIISNFFFFFFGGGGGGVCVAQMFGTHVALVRIGSDKFEEL